MLASRAGVVRGFAAMLVLLSTAPTNATAQSAASGVLELVLPIGARTLGMGLAATANAIGSDALWWNPALIARGPREVGLQITQTLASQTGADAAVGAIYSVPHVGAIGLSLRYLNQGSQPGTDDAGNQNATFSVVSSIAAATFAAPFGDRVAIGLTTKLLQIRYPCTGVCTNVPSSPPQTGAIDIGAHYLVRTDSLVAIGVAVRNLGPKLQVNDAPQADALPQRAYFGIAAAPKFAELPPDVRVRAAADIVIPLSPGVGTGVNFGGELSYKARYQLRAGYVSSPEESGPTFGVGVSTGKLQIDFARLLNAVSIQAGVTPTFIAVRYLY